MITREQADAEISRIRFNAIDGDGSCPRLDREFREAVETGEWETFEASLEELAVARLRREEWLDYIYKNYRHETWEEFQERNLFMNPFINLPDFDQ